MGNQPAAPRSLARAPRGVTSLAAAITVITWGSAFAGIRAGLEAYSPAHLALLRFSVASLALAAYAAAIRMPLPKPRDLPLIALLGLVGLTFYNLALNYGELTVTAATASLLIATTPVWMALLATLLYRERLAWMGWFGIGLAFVGVAIIALGEGQGIRLEGRALAILAAALASCAYSLGQKRLLVRYKALQCTAWAIWAGTLFLLPFAAGLPSAVARAPLAATMAVVYLGVVPAALGYATWAYVLARLPAGVAGSLLYLVPASATAIAWLWLGEAPAAPTLLGGALVMVGVMVVNRWGRERVR
ncbi:MAG: DMT family transporter [Anaerolineae bacterium]